MTPIERIDPAAAAKTRTFRLNGQTINGKSMDMSRIDATVDPGAIEIWEITGQDGTPHNFHIHGVHFQVLSVADGQPPPELGGWKDTVFLEGNQTTTRVIARFPAYADPATRTEWHQDAMLLRRPPPSRAKHRCRPVSEGRVGPTDAPVGLVRRGRGAVFRETR